MIPQIIIITLVAFKIGVAVKGVAKKDDKGEYNSSIVTATLCANIFYYGMLMGILYWGGFFDVLTTK